MRVKITDKASFAEGKTYFSNVTIPNSYPVRVLWSITHVKKPWECCRCGRKIPEKGEAYRPLNGGPRLSQCRLCSPCMLQRE